MILPVDMTKGQDLNGKREYFALDWKTVQEKIPWGILLLFGGGFALAGGFGATGLDTWIGGKLTGIAGWPLWCVVLGICLAITFLTELTSNTATTTMILPILGVSAVAAKYSSSLFYGAGNVGGILRFHVTCCDTAECHCIWQWLGDDSSNVTCWFCSQLFRGRHCDHRCFTFG